MANECSSYCKSWKLIVCLGVTLSMVKYKHDCCVQIVSLGINGYSYQHQLQL